ncbi:NAD(P)/FAD-dependent oxidoreductase [Hydrogenophaga sp. A37]|uniref:NAD(P)/FAD-dependent oxidoreductase n=1 Tax=Hydrogenophaga sp. A37 TaxID=1945864 RepID=UPI00098534F2|nr:FAD-binding oxidoreductase [Hydrogenophaga sp. A37]OOG83143.1 FAD-dependent oxidoreductase [Hydrogenophaga sp. A37]
MTPAPDPTSTADFIVIGAGIAGASVAHWLAPHGRVLLLERESQPGYHSTGRSAALYMASYGSAQVRALTRASLAFFESPPAGFSEHPLLSPRGAMMVATEAQMPELEAHWAMLAPLNPQAVRLTGAQACDRVPALRPEQVAGAVYEPDAADMDVHAIHEGFLRGVRHHGGQIVCDAEVASMHRSDGQWTVSAGGRTWRAPLVLNAAGAWAEVVGQMAGARPIGLVPKRRSAFVFHPPKDLPVASWPLVFGAAEDWYIKPDAGVLLGSPANADPVPPQDVQPEELDIAMAIHRIGEMTTLEVTRPIRTWAGLRSFVEDGGLVGGFDPQAEGFFWVAAQGGYGIQTSPAMGEACAALARGLPLPSHIAAEGLDAAQLGPARLNRPQST